MTAPVLTDLAGREFTEGDYVVYSSVNGIRYGRVDWIKDITPTNIQVRNGHESYKVYVDLSFHKELPDRTPGRMFVKRMGYEYSASYFLKVSPIV